MMSLLDSLIADMRRLDELLNTIDEAFAGRIFLDNCAVTNPKNVRRVTTYIKLLKEVENLRSKIIDDCIKLRGIPLLDMKALLPMLEASNRGGVKQNAPVAPTAPNKQPLSFADVSKLFDTPETFEKFRRIQTGPTNEEQSRKA
jgi:hypothetical protein